MKKNVFVKVVGVQNICEVSEQMEPIELMTNGTLEKDENGYTLTYEEVFEDMPGSTTNIVRISPERVEVTKTGQISTEMVFEVGCTTMTLYDTPFGSIDMGFTASSVEVKEEEDSMDVKIAYAISVNDQHMAECRLDMTIESR